MEGKSRKRLLRGEKRDKGDYVKVKGKNKYKMVKRNEGE